MGTNEIWSLVISMGLYATKVFEANGIREDNEPKWISQIIRVIFNKAHERWIIRNKAMHGLENGMSEASRRFLYRKLCQQYSYAKLLN